MLYISISAAYKQAKALEINVIFGCEMYIVDDSDLMVKTNNLDDLEKKNITEESFVVFDLETLGLNPRYNEIIEIEQLRLKMVK